MNKEAIGFLLEEADLAYVDMESTLEAKLGVDLPNFNILKARADTDKCPVQVQV